MLSKNLKFMMVVCFVTLSVVILAYDVAFASSTSTALPWETPLKTIQDSITGPVAKVVSILAIVAVGITLIFGGDMQGFIRQVLYVTLVIGLIIMASNIITTLYGDQVTSALITISSLM